MRYVVVSTYPRGGTRNIGDKLIETATAKAIRDRDSTAEISTVWRAEAWENVRGTAGSADHVVLACLAIRVDMAAIYPYLSDLLDLGVPISAISAGTSLKTQTRDIFGNGFSGSDIDLLRRFADSARVFTTRGALTQAFCVAQGLAGVQMTGDVAFIDPRFDGRRFEPRKQVRTVVVSDPHDGENFTPVFRQLVAVLRRIFPDARIDTVLHGENPTIRKVADRLGIAVRPIYEEPESGLDSYDDYDLHVGFRVHGHVRALTRRIPSYLLEQDGRGADYGLTLERKISVPCYRVPRTFGTRSAQVLRLVRGLSVTRQIVASSSADMLGALVANDAARDFANFRGFEETIARFQLLTGDAIRRICRPDRN